MDAVNLSRTSVPERPRLRRRQSDRILAGVAGGLADHLGVPTRVVRVAFVALTFTGGLGALVYVMLWALTPPDGITQRPGAHPSAGRRPAGGALAGRPNVAVRALLAGAVLLLVGAAILAGQSGADLHLGWVLPAVIVAAGAFLAFRQLDEAERGRWLATAGGSSRGGLVRLGGGVLLAVAGVLLIVVQGTDGAVLGSVLLASLAVLVGVALVLAPWGVRLWRDLEEERAARVRESERAELAAHLHDSVLQTLALIQRRPGDATEVSRLARAQERELRAWLYGAPAPSSASLQSQVRQLVAHIEDDYGVPVNSVLVGDRPVDARRWALVQALREALLNAVRHGGTGVSVYLECGPDTVEAFVRDRGPGFELADVPADRLGVRESVVGRMQRQGGSATIRSAAGDGTEVALRLPDPQEASA